MRKLDLAAQGTSLRREIVAGATTFATMSYIIFVQPTVLAKAGMDFGAVMVATCVGSAVATALMGWLANYPIALAPAMGHNFYFAFGVCLAMGIPWPVALGANFLAGAAFVVLSAVGVRERIISAIPASLQHAIAAGIGLLIGFIGLQWGGLVEAQEGTLVKLGNLASPPALLTVGGLVLLFSLYTLRVPGAILLTMLATTIAGLAAGLLHYRGIVSWPPSPAPTLLRLDVLGALRPGMIEVVFVFFFLALFDTVGTLIGVADRAGLLRNGQLPRARRALLADSLGIVHGTLWGTSTITSYVESAAGVAEGGRTGLANYVTAGLFVAALFVFPLAQTIGSGVPTGSAVLYPVVAPPLVLIGAFMLASAAKIDWSDPGDGVPAFLCMTMMPFTLSIADGIGFGIIAHCLIRLVQRRGAELHWLLLAAAAIFILRFGLRS